MSALKPKYCTIESHSSTQAQILYNRHPCQHTSPNIVQSIPVSALKPKYCIINSRASTQAQILYNRFLCQHSSPNIVQSIPMSALKPKCHVINSCVSTQAQILYNWILYHHSSPNIVQSTRTNAAQVVDCVLDWCRSTWMVTHGHDNQIVRTGYKPKKWIVIVLKMICKHWYSEIWHSRTRPVPCPSRATCLSY